VDGFEDGVEFDFSHSSLFLPLLGATLLVLLRSTSDVSDEGRLSKVRGPSEPGALNSLGLSKVTDPNARCMPDHNK
jgi:hypothetical protein